MNLTLNHCRFCLILIFIIILFYIVVYSLQQDGNSIENQLNIVGYISTKHYTNMFLDSIKLNYKLTDENIDEIITKFKFSKNLFNLNFRSKSWENDPDLFIQCCLTTLSLLSHFIDKNSLFYRDQKTLHIITYATRLLGIKIITSHSDNYRFNENMHHVYIALIISFSIINLCQQGDLEDTFEYIQYYRKRFKTKTFYSILYDSLDSFPGYRNLIKMCKNYVYYLINYK